MKSSKIGVLMNQKRSLYLTLAQMPGERSRRPGPAFPRSTDGVIAIVQWRRQQPETQELHASLGSVATTTLPFAGSLNSRTTVIAGSRAFTINEQSGEIASGSTSFPFIVRFRPPRAGCSESHVTIMLDNGETLSFDLVGIAE
jgi:hypothetical protein